MRVPHMHMQKPVVLSTLTLQPILSNGINLVRRLQAELANIVGLIKTRIPMKGGVALGE